MAANEHTNHRGWTDLDQVIYRIPPNVVITKENTDANAAGHEVGAELPLLADIYVAGMRRKVIYEDDQGTKFLYELELYTHPTGAGDITLHTKSTGVQDCKGQFIGRDGVLAGAAELNRDVAGLFFTDYYEFHADSDQDFHVETLTAGDSLWLIVKGRALCRSDAAWNADVGLITAANGELTPAATPVDGNEVDHQYGGALGTGIAVSNEAAAGGNEYKLCDVDIAVFYG